MDIELHPAQSEIFNALFEDKGCRVAVVNASRGFGKSVLAAVCALKAISELCQLPETVPNKNVAVIAPTFSQVQDIYVPLLVNTFGIDKFCTRWTKDGTFEFPNQVILKLWSYEASERMRGTGQYFVVCDEVTSWVNKPGLMESWQGIIQPCMTTRWSQESCNRIKDKHGIEVAPWRSLIISTPQGYDSFYDMFQYEKEDSDWKSWHYTYHDSPYLDEKEIEKTRKTIDYLKFNREYLASFEESGLSVFYNFDRNTHVRDDLDWFQPGEDVHVCIDFNVGTMACSAFALRGDQMHFLWDSTGHPDTESLAKDLQSRFAGHRIITYPDPSGRARKTSAATGVTDFSILKSHGLQTLARSKAPPIVDSVQCVNTHLKNADGDVRMYFASSLTDTIRSMERTTWKEGNDPTIMTIDKTEGYEHWSDGIRYATEYLFPVRSGKRKMVGGFGF